MREDIHLGRVAGVRVGANWSLLVVFWLIAWGLAGTELPDAARGYPAGAYWAAGLAVALVFYACLLAHELAHAVVARRAGIEVEGIVLWLFGGVSRFKGEAGGPDIELRVSLAGPATSAALGLAFFALTRLVAAVIGAPLLAAGLGWLGWINGILAVFNLAPALPLDGGRVLRAMLWRHHGDKLRATTAAARAGRAFGFALIGFGLLEFAAGAGLGGLWLVFLGWFVLAAAGAEAASSILEAQLTGVPVRLVMTPDPLVVPTHLTVQQLLEGWLYPNRCSTFPLVDVGGSFAGLITLARVKRIRPELRSSTLISQIACLPSDVVTCGPDEDLIAVVRRMNTSADQRAVVLDHGRIVGIVSPSDITRAVEHAGLSRR